MQDVVAPPTSATRRVLQVIVLLAIGLPAVAFVGVMIGELVPDRWVAEELGKAALAGQLTEDNYQPGLVSSQVDGFTDCVAITIGLGDVPGRNPVTSAIASESLWDCPEAVPELRDWMAGEGALTRQFDYFRYWHGHVLILRPSIAAFGLPATRFLMTLALLGVTLGLGRSLARRYGVVVGLVALGPFVLTTDFVDLGRALPHATGVLAGLSTSWLAHEVVSRRVDPSRIIFVSAVSGAAVVYFDILTSAPGLWALCTFVVGAAASRVQTGIRLFGSVSLAAVAWIIGYGWTWATKWILSIFVFGYDRVRAVIDYTLNNRLSGDVSGLDFSLLRTLERNFDEWWRQPLTGWVVTAVGVLLAVEIVRRGRTWVERWPDRLLLAAIALIVPVWFELLRNHSQIHYWFTYRSLGLAFGVAAAALAMPLRPIDAPVADDPMRADRDMSAR